MVMLGFTKGYVVLNIYGFTQPLAKILSKLTGSGSAKISLFYAIGFCIVFHSAERCF